MFLQRQLTLLVQVLEEVLNRYLQHLGKSVESAGDNPIAAALVLLDLLKGYAQGFSQSGLAYAQGQTPLPKPGSN